MNLVGKVITLMTRVWDYQDSRSLNNITVMT